MRPLAAVLLPLLLLLLAVLSVAGAADFTAIYPGGHTICSTGGEYAFMYRPGTVNKLVIFFEGGGACWSSDSCILPIYTQSVDVSGILSNLNSMSSGINSQDPRNPTASWHSVFVPYCSADAHGGNATVDFGLYSINFRGRVNAQAAIDFAYGKVPTPDAVATFGCSAGSLGSYINAPYIMKLYNNGKTNLYQFGDSYAGVFAQAQYNEAYTNWQLQLAPFLKLNASTWFQDIGGYIISGGANYFPGSVWSAYTSDYDIVQTAFWELGGGKGNWTALMRDQVGYAIQHTKNVYTFIASSDKHCVTQSDDFWTTTSQNVHLYEWITQMVTNNQSIQQHVDCAPDCTLFK